MTDVREAADTARGILVHAAVSPDLMQEGFAALDVLVAASERTATLEAALAEIRDECESQIVLHGIGAAHWPFNRWVFDRCNWAIARAALAVAGAADSTENPDEAFERSLLRADIKTGNADAAAMQLERAKRLGGTEETG